MAAPLDPDRPPRPLYLRPAALALVLAGGAVGTAVREALSLVVPTPGGFPLGILSINLVGAFLLGLLLEALVRSGPDSGGRRVLRLLLGTGFCGGFTTFSALAAAVALLLTAGRPGVAVAYGLLTVLGGGLTTWLGILAGASAVRRA